MQNRHSSPIASSRQASLIRHTVATVVAFFVGSGLYYFIEIAVRGWSHWSMAVCGGLCLAGIYHINRILSHQSILTRALCGAGLITLVEFVAGCILNVWLKMGIWSYAAYTLNLLGQICLYMSFLWFLLSIPACWICMGLHKIASSDRLFLKSAGRSMGGHAVYHADQNVGSKQ